jgi:hypothetical protein
MCTAGIDELVMQPEVDAGGRRYVEAVQSVHGPQVLSEAGEGRHGSNGRASRLSSDSSGCRSCGGRVTHMEALQQRVQKALGALSSSITQVDNMRLRQQQQQQQQQHHAG